MTTGSRLGDYLRARRERLRPADVGLPEGGRRRVPGLRREEVALLAGISVEYYLRLEQGRDQHPSQPVLAGLARALRLGPDAERHLYALADVAHSTAGGAPDRPESVSPAVVTLIDNWTTTPALVHGRAMTTLAANAMAVALNPLFAPGVNTLRAAFLDPSMRDFYRDWDAMTAKTVAYLRSLAGAADDPRIAEVIGELSLRSERFRDLWARQDVHRRTSGLTLIRHPRVGPLDLHYEKLALPSAPGQMLVTYHAEPGTPSYDRLRRLARLTSQETDPAPYDGAPARAAR
ncbi:helix-turn-helix transcriptional regulator [Streptomyces sp. NPDC004031]